MEAEFENDIDFPMVNVTKLTMVDGYTSKEKGNPELGFIMHQRIGDALLKFAKEKAADGGILALVEEKRKAEEVTRQGDTCGEVSD